MANNKIVYYGETLIDLTSDTVTASDLAKNVTAHDKTGAIITGTSTKDSDTSDATISVAEMLATKTAYARGTKLTGTMPNIGKQTGAITTKTGSVSISQGYHDGSGAIAIDTTAVAQLIPANLRAGCSVLGIDGEMTGSEDENPETGKQVTPSKVDQTITPSTGFTCFRELVVKAVPYTTSQNSAGGMTVTIG